MLKSIQVDGLRSLSDFKLDLKPGLNVLVGPNGSGKTNILTALDVIGNSTFAENLNNRNSFGGIEIAKLFDIKDNARNITISALGEIEISLKSDETVKEIRRGKAILSYEFKFEIGNLQSISDMLTFAYQSLKLQLYHDKRHHKFETEFKDGKLRIKRSDDMFLKHMLKCASSQITKDSMQMYFEQFHSKRDNLATRSIVYELSFIMPQLKAVLDELESLQLFDLDPNSIRENFQTLGEPKINRDGSGVQNVLLKICREVKALEPITDDPLDKFRGIRGLHGAIVSYLDIFLKDIADLNVYLDERHQKIVGEIIMEDGTKFPIERLSDGSLKMLTIYTLLFEENDFLMLETPENYLNPRMVHLIMELIRDENEVHNHVQVLTTNCETMMNKLEPEEVIMTKFKDGKTTAGRFADPEVLRNAIYESGLGLGWYYHTRALDNKQLV